MKSSKIQFVGKKVKLGELCEICSGGTPKRSVAEYWKDGTIPWVKIGDMSEKYVSSTEERITDAGFNNSSVKMLEPGTLLYSIFASIGAVSILKIPATTNQAIAGLKIKDDSLDRDFLYHYLKSRESISKSSGRGAALNICSFQGHCYCRRRPIALFDDYCGSRPPLLRIKATGC